MHCGATGAAAGRVVRAHYRPALPQGGSESAIRVMDPSQRSEPAIRVSDLSPRRRLICGNGGRGVASAAAGFAASIRVRAARTGRRGAR